MLTDNYVKAEINSKMKANLRKREPPWARTTEGTLTPVLTVPTDLRVRPGMSKATRNFHSPIKKIFIE